jgi:hypothetical protein
LLTRPRPASNAHSLLGELLSPCPAPRALCRRRRSPAEHPHRESMRWRTRATEFSRPAALEDRSRNPESFDWSLGDPRQTCQPRSTQDLLGRLAVSATAGLRGQLQPTSPLSPQPLRAVHLGQPLDRGRRVRKSLLASVLFLFKIGHNQPSSLQLARNVITTSRTPLLREIRRRT